MDLLDGGREQAALGPANSELRVSSLSSLKAFPLEEMEPCAAIAYTAPVPNTRAAVKTGKVESTTGVLEAFGASRLRERRD